jgi:monothiol glutaredoxin
MDWNKKIDEQIAANKVMVYMRGSRQAPRCGFSARVMNVLGQLEVPFETEDMDQDRALWNTLAERNDWPTSPQIFIKGQFIGGCDILIEMFKSGELKQMLESE